MKIRETDTWCPDCTAPELWAENLPAVELFLQALPTYEMPGAGRIQEGFHRAELLALMDLRGTAPAERPALWEQVAELEAEFRHIRQAKARAETPVQPHVNAP